MIEDERNKIADVPCGNIQDQSNGKHQSLNAEVEEERAGVILMFDLCDKVRPEPLQEQSHSIQQNSYDDSS